MWCGLARWLGRPIGLSGKLRAGGPLTSGSAFALAFALISAAAAAQRYPVTGIILKVDPVHRSFSASCAAIPGYMEAMTMQYSVRSDKELANLKPGAYVEFTLVVEKNSSYAENLKPHRFESTDNELMLVRQLELLHPPASSLRPGDTAPDFTLTDQTGARVSLSQLTGKVVGVTFIYTTCPLPNYCFRLSNNFGRLSKRFAGRMGRDLVLLSITYDPVHDRPAVLAQYAATWNADPRSWHFLTGSLEEVKSVCRRFGLNFWQADGVLAHSLHTLVIDRSGKLAADFEGNEFTADLLGDVVSTLLQLQ